MRAKRSKMKKIGNSILNWFINSSSVSYTSCLVKLLRLRLRCSSCSDGKNDGWVGCVTSMLARKPNPCAKIWLTLRMLSLVLTRNYFRQIFRKIKKIKIIKKTYFYHNSRARLKSHSSSHSTCLFYYRRGIWKLFYIIPRWFCWRCRVYSIGINNYAQKK